MRIYATFSPTAVLQGGYHLEAKIIEDLKRFNQKKLIPPRDQWPILEQSKTLGLDTEFSPSGELLTLGVATKGAAKAAEVSDKAAFRKACSLIKQSNIIIGQSLAGDLDYLVRLGLAKKSWLKGKNIFDSFLLARMVDENKGKGGYGLEALLLGEMSFTPWKDETTKLLKQTGDASSWSVEQRTKRCRLDAWAAYVLAKHFLDRLKK